MYKSLAILCLVLFAFATLTVAAEEKKQDDLKTEPIKTLAGKKLIIGSPDLSGAGGGKFEKGATRIAMHHPVGNFKNWPNNFMTYVNLDAPVQQEMIEAYLAFHKKHPSKKGAAIIVEVLESDLSDPDNLKIKVRLLGAAHFPENFGENFTDADLKDQPYLPFAVSKEKAEEKK